jgi:heme-degrading monooxygenase HmoA
MDWHLAQVNIGRLRAPVDHPMIAEFVAGLDRINALADRATGFVWRLQTEDGNATAIRPDAQDALLAINMSVWESVEALDAFVRSAPHAAMVRRRREWFERMAEAYLVLWWIPRGELPNPEGALERLAHLRAHGPGPRAFTFRRRFEPRRTEQSFESTPAGFRARERTPNSKSP